MKIKKPNKDLIILSNLLQKYNFIFGKCFIKNDNVIIKFYSQYQIERLLDLSSLKEFGLNFKIEKFDISSRNLHKIVFYFSFNKEYLKKIIKKLSK